MKIQITQNTFEKISYEHFQGVFAMFLNTHMDKNTEGIKVIVSRLLITF